MKLHYFYLFICIILLSFISKEKITKVKYDYIIGYNYNVEDSILPKKPSFHEYSIVRDGKIQYMYVQKEKKLTPSEATKILQTINSIDTYSGDSHACFEPRLTYVLYKEDNIVGYIDICFECIGLESTLFIPAKYKVEKKYTTAGISETGKSNLKQITDKIGLYSYSE
ncbi:MAG: hypothetical protein U0U66_08370 [Cytophagaceae bacterium]